MRQPAPASTKITDFYESSLEVEHLPIWIQNKSNHQHSTAKEILFPPFLASGSCYVGVVTTTVVTFASTLTSHWRQVGEHTPFRAPKVVTWGVALYLLALGGKCRKVINSLGLVFYFFSSLRLSTFWKCQGLSESCKMLFLIVKPSYYAYRMCHFQFSLWIS